MRRKFTRRIKKFSGILFVQATSRNYLFISFSLFPYIFNARGPGIDARRLHHNVIFLFFIYLFISRYIRYV